ncbi:Protein-L-isoaspartateD-aspartate O-methyltransferase [Hondaea fermentalgiana]|uniref:protein-L-isoaspartate(D-aspartate) O-methyltransferase n=1 Tax=Hondaea fermentalgiana TaxID=2315210 RepID=A0A2R5G265_9STRA|nr:Protein-L-isoaspartateD-aspartate O-methyltransferase [Hondaea fermentalgiana]|eukprot:GBG25106.1 Protein-L-isoaspartateD-aspartate O-methyltransferase [Hondaea fermentalgiana]
MAWRCSAASNTELVANLHKHGLCKTESVLEALRATDRQHYAPSSAYEDAPQYIGHGATISAPHMHAWALELLSSVLDRPRAAVLDVGCGSGYLTACLHRMVAPRGGTTVAIDYLPALVEMTRENLHKDDAALADAIKLHVGDGWKGSLQDGPFDAIHVGAAADGLPQALVDQLRPGGRMIIPVGPQDGDQHLFQYDKDTEGKLTSKIITGVRYVPLVRAHS